jgi:SAM-dependent methyltransferase
MADTLDKGIFDTLVEDAGEVWPSGFDDIENMFNRCCFANCVEVMKQLGLFQKKNEFESFESIKKKINLFKDAQYVLRQVLEILCEEKVLEKGDGGYICLDEDPDIETPAETLVEAVRKFPQEGAPFQWLARAYDGLVRFITGKLYAEEVMFPWSSFKLLEEVYNTSNVYGFYSRLAGKTIKRLVQEIYHGPVTMIEIGAGTGNGTRNVLNEINDKFSKYIFTDVSKALVQRAERKMKKLNYDFIEYRDFDVSRDPSSQEIEEGFFDMVLAVNVIHATDDLLISIKNCHKLLKEGGWLILSEIAPPPNGLYRYMELTFGLLPSYSIYNDNHLRPASAIVRPDVWVSLFSQAGFKEIKAIPGSSLPGIDRGGVVIGRK